MGRYLRLPSLTLEAQRLSARDVTTVVPREWESFSGYSIRVGTDGRPVAVLTAAPGLMGQGSCFDDDWSCGAQQEVFDLPSLELRVANLRRGGLDASLSELALAELRQAAAAHRPAVRRPSLLQDRRGTSTIEYAILALGVVVMAGACIALAMPALQNAFDRSATAVLVEQNRLIGSR